MDRLDRILDSAAVPGAGLIVRKDGRTLYEHATGDQDVHAVRLLASATKLASATTVMTLVDDGLIDLDRRIADYLPEFQDEKGELTVRRLLSQTHGLPFTHPSIPAPQRDNGMTLGESVTQIARDVAFEWPPGTRHAYMPAVSYHIAGRIAEVVSGKAWNDLFDERVRGPLDMTSTTYGPTPNPRIGGGAASCLRDYANLLEMHLAGGGSVLSRESVKELQRNQVGEFTVTGTQAKRECGYGLMWWFDVAREGVAVQVSCAGAWGAIPWLNVDRHYVAFLLIQKTLADGVAIYDEVLPLVDELAT